MKSHAIKSIISNGAVILYRNLFIFIKEKKIELTFIPPQSPIPNVKADKLRIGEVLTNLISNALNYTEPGGKVKIWAEKQDEFVVTHIQDTGEGISKEAQEKLFKKFYRAPGRLSQGIKGTGLGLYITKAIVDMHHGKIWVNSELGKGSTFSFTLPEDKGNLDISKENFAKNIAGL